MKIGIGSYTFGWASGAYGASRNAGHHLLSSNALVDLAERFSVDVVQICVQPSLHDIPERDLIEIGAYARRKNIRIEVGTIGSDPAHLLDYLRIARIVGAQTVRTIVPNASRDLSELRTSVAEILGDYEDAKTILAVENHEAYSCAELGRVCRDFSSSCFGVCLDTVNSLGAGEGVKEVTEELLPHVRMLHVKDFVSIRGEDNQLFTITGAPAGQGRLDIPWLLRRVLGEHPKLDVILEHWTPFDGSWEKTIRTQEEWTKTGLAYLRDQLNELLARG